MSSRHLFASYGSPPVGGIMCRAQQPTRWAVQYGSPATGSYFELEGDEINLALPGLPTFPTGLFA